MDWLHVEVPAFPNTTTCARSSVADLTSEGGGGGVVADSSQSVSQTAPAIRYLSVTPHVGHVEGAGTPTEWTSPNSRTTHARMQLMCRPVGADSYTFAGLII